MRTIDGWATVGTYDRETKVRGTAQVRVELTIKDEEILRWMAERLFKSKTGRSTALAGKVKAKRLAVKLA